MRFGNSKTVGKIEEGSSMGAAHELFEAIRSHLRNSALLWLSNHKKHKNFAILQIHR